MTSRRRHTGWVAQFCISTLLVFCVTQNALSASFHDTRTTEDTTSNTLRIAVASNFIGAFEAIKTAFQRHYNYTVEATYGSTGQLYAQILRGAPYDIFLAADEAAIDRLSHTNAIVNQSRAIYACGRLLLASTQMIRSDKPNDTQTLLNNSHLRLAIANPKLAPYGRAAMEVLDNLNIKKRPENTIVWGQNIGQIFHYVISGNAQLGFIAASQVQQYDAAEKLSLWPVPDNLHTPIKQQMGITQRGADNNAAQAFHSFMSSDQATDIIRANSYSVPPEGC